MKVEPTNGGILIIGAGIAGLYTALSLAPHPVTVITSGRVGRRAASSWAQGGLAAAMAPGDSPADHAADTITAGAGLVDPEAAQTLCQEGPAHIHRLLELGVPFDKDASGALKLGREAAHGKDRIVHVGGDEAGATIMQHLMDAAMAAEHIDLQERLVAYRLITDDRGVNGAMVWDADAESHRAVVAQHTVLATGGAGALFAVTTNPLTATGQGLVLAHDAGAALRDIEFVQFHPTGLDIGKDPAPLATEALRGEGATLRDCHGRRFMAALHPDAELAPRDVVARGVATAIAETGHAYLDAREAIGPRFKDRFPTVHRACTEVDLDPALQPMPIAPAAHYHMGGVLTDLNGRTTIDGLWAVGEVASTGVHGANRLASNSLLEALVFGSRCAEHLKDHQAVERPTPALPAPPDLVALPARTIGPFREQMAAACGLLRNKDGLTALSASLSEATPQTLGDELALSSMRLIVTAALTREESRGAHQRTDHPDASVPSHSITENAQCRLVPRRIAQEAAHG